MGAREGHPLRAPEGVGHRNLARSVADAGNDQRWSGGPSRSRPQQHPPESLRWEEHINLASGWALLPGTKTAKARRKVPIPEPLALALETITKHSGAVVAPWANVCRDTAVACRKVGIARVSPNDLRRTYASWMKKAGVDSAVVAKLLGHSSTRMVDLVYGHLGDENFITAAAKLPVVEVPPIGSTLETADGRFQGLGGILGPDAA